MFQSKADHQLYVKMTHAAMMHVQNQNSILVIRQINTYSPGPVTEGKQVPCSHKRYKLEI